jgi:cyclohexanone monooxygenase
MRNEGQQPAAHANEVDAVVVGTGFAGLYAIHRLRGLGLTLRAFEAGGGVGGTWYWNRYPGARCDVESMQYSFSFDEALQQEWEWTERYPSQVEILRYLDHVADRFDLRRDITFDTRVVAAGWDATAGRWLVETDRGDRVAARFIIMATGALSAARKPEIPGLDSFNGRWFHTGSWPRETIDFTGQRVGVIGTGSSGIQTIPAVAQQAGHVTVFQRTPNFSIPAWNQQLNAESQRSWKASYPALRQKARATRSGILYDYSARGALEVDAAEREAEFDRRWARGGANFTHAFNDIFINSESNELAAEYVRGRIRSIVKDPAVASKLTPTDHPIGTKRICVDTDYYATFNRPNVTLVDVRDDPIEAITPGGIRTRSREWPLDSIVFATGYDAVTGALMRIAVTGRDGTTIQQRWADGPVTYLGLMVAGFPNLFTVTGPGSPSILTNVVVSIEQHVEWIADCLAAMREAGLTRIEATEQAEADWVREVAQVASGTLFPRANSWYMGANVPGKPRVFLPWVGGFARYVDICNDIAARGYPGFARS